jgi:hypothetical protein
MVAVFAGRYRENTFRQPDLYGHASFPAPVQAVDLSQQCAEAPSRRGISLAQYGVFAADRLAEKEPIDLRR